MEKRRVRPRPSNSRNGRSDASKSTRTKGRAKRDDQSDPYWKAQQTAAGRRTTNRAPGKIELTIPLDAATQFKAEGSEVIIAHSVGYTIRFVLTDDPMLFRKMMEVVDGLEVARRVEKMVAEMAAKQAAKPPDTDPDQSLRRSRGVLTQKGVPSAEQARRALKRRGN